MKALRPFDLRILSLSAQNEAGINISTLSKTLNITAQNVYSHLTKLNKKGFMERKSHFWFITAQGLVEVRNALSHQAVNQPSKRIFMGLIYRHKQPLDATEPVRLMQEAKEFPFHAVELKNTNQAIIKVKLTARLTSKALTLYSKDFYYKRGQLSIEQEARLKEHLDAYARELERRLHLDLLEVKKDMLYSEILQEEVADEHHPLAKATPSYQSKIVLARHPIDKKERLIADMSKGFKELEAVRAQSSGEDSDTVDSQFNGLLDQKINLWHIPFLMQNYEKQSKLLTEYARQIELHLKVMQKIDRKLSQRRLFE